MNNLFSMLGGLSGGSGTNILLQAVGAALRGESPQAFNKEIEELAEVTALQGRFQRG